MIARLRRSNGNIYRDEQRRAVLKENNFFPVRVLRIRLPLLMHVHALADPKAR